MKKMKYFLGFMMMTAIMVIANSCAEDIPTYTTETFVGCSDPGNLNVLVCDATQSNYFGGAEVFLYKTDAERTADPQRSNYYRKAITDNSDPQNKGGIFYQLAFQKYFFFARRDLGGGNFLTGAGEAFAKSCVTTNAIAVVQ